MVNFVSSCNILNIIGKFVHVKIQVESNNIFYHATYGLRLTCSVHFLVDKWKKYSIITKLGELGKQLNLKSTKSKASFF